MNLGKIILASLVFCLICSCNREKNTKVVINDQIIEKPKLEISKSGDVLGKTVEEILSIFGEPDDGANYKHEPFKNDQDKKYIPYSFYEYNRVTIYFDVNGIAIYVDEGEIEKEREILFGKHHLNSSDFHEDDLPLINAMLIGVSKVKVRILFLNYLCKAETRIWKFQNVEIYFDSENKVTKLVLHNLTKGRK